ARAVAPPPRAARTPRGARTPCRLRRRNPARGGARGFRAPAAPRAAGVTGAARSRRASREPPPRTRARRAAARAARRAGPAADRAAAREGAAAVAAGAARTRTRRRRVRRARAHASSAPATARTAAPPRRARPAGRAPPAPRGRAGPPLPTAVGSRRTARRAASRGLEHPQERGAHRARLALVVREQLLAGARPAVAEAPREQQQLAAAGGQMADGPVAHDPESALEAPQEAVPARERLRVGFGEQTEPAQLGERAERR